MVATHKIQGAYSILDAPRDQMEYQKASRRLLTSTLVIAWHVVV